jgi:hypothetical protein
MVDRAAAINLADLIIARQTSLCVMCLFHLHQDLQGLQVLTTVLTLQTTHAIHLVALVAAINLVDLIIVRQANLHAICLLHQALRGRHKQVSKAIVKI